MAYLMPERACDWQAKMREFVERHLIPHGVEAEMNDGFISQDALIG